MASMIIPLIVSMILGGGLYFFIGGLPLDTPVKMIIVLVVILASYTILAEVFHTKYTY
ncbi:MAG: hypothetical protein ABSA11_09590 [Candidatus Bathyarchaeia archaeon]|jgi:hypothetical protein